MTQVYLALYKGRCIKPRVGRDMTTSARWAWFCPCGRLSRDGFARSGAPMRWGWGSLKSIARAVWRDAFQAAFWAWRNTPGRDKPIENPPLKQRGNAEKYGRDEGALGTRRRPLAKADEACISRRSPRGRAAGNAVCPPVARWIAEKLIRTF